MIENLSATPSAKPSVLCKFSNPELMINKFPLLLNDNFSCTRKGSSKVRLEMDMYCTLKQYYTGIFCTFFKLW